MTAEWGQVVNLLELAQPLGPLAVDREQGIIRGVRVIGRKSMNRREYTAEALRKALGMYESRQVNVDHPAKPESERKVSDRFGWLQNVREGDDGLVADLHFLKSHPLANQITEAAERNPRLFGLSHNADGRVAKRNGQVLVEEIIGVRSVDIVADPATTKSLFESIAMKESSMDETITDMAPAPAPAAAADIKSMIVAKITEILDGDGEAAAKASQISKVVKALLKVEDQVDAAMKPADKPAEGGDDKEPTKESLIRELSQLKAETAARALLESAHVETTPIRVKALTALTDEAERKALVETWPKVQPGQRPRSVAPLTEAAKPGDGYQPPKDAKELAARLKSKRR